MLEAYLFISVASVLFSIQFAFTKQYQTVAGTDKKATFLYNALSPIAFAVIMLAIEGFKMEFTWFSLFLSLVWAVVSCVITYFSIKALALGSVGNYSLFMMAGGMVLPAVYGVFFGDDFGIFKILGIALVLLAVVLRIDFKEKTGGKALLCFFALFVLNGSVGIISTLHQTDLFSIDRVSATQFSMMRAFTTAVVGAIFFAFYAFTEKREETSLLKTYAKASPWAAIGGLINGIANLLLLLSLKTLQPSLQYPIITGGCIFLSAFTGFIFHEKPTKKEWISVFIAVMGTVIMIFD